MRFNSSIWNYQLGLLAKVLTTVVAAVCVSLMTWMPSSADKDCWPGPNKDLSSCDMRSSQHQNPYDLENSDLSFVLWMFSQLEYSNFRNANLTNANLSSSQLGFSNLSGANLKSAGLTEANLYGVDLSNANLDGTGLQSANLKGVSSGGITGEPEILPTGWLLKKGYLVGPEADLTGADLTGADLTGADLTGANLTGANLTGAKFARARVSNLKTGNLIGVPASLPTEWSLLGGYLFGPSANLMGANLSGLELRSLNLVDANFGGANLAGAKLIECRLEGVSFAGADLTSFVLSKSSISGANFRGATVNKAMLYNATGSVWTGVVSGNLIFNPSTPPTLLPLRFKIFGGYLVGPGAVLDGAVLDGFDTKGMNLDGFDFSGAELSGIKSGNTTGQPLLPPLWKLNSGLLIGPGADLGQSNLGSVDLSDSNLDHVKSGGITGLPSALPPGWKLLKGYLVGPKANLENSNLNSADLSETNLDGARLLGAKLVGVKSGGIIGTPMSMPNYYALISGYILGRQANLEGAQLQDLNLKGLYLQDSVLENANLSNSNLSEANLMGANLRNANFSQADLSGAYFMRADIEGANFSGAELPLGNMYSVVGIPAALPESWEMENGEIVRSSETSWTVEISGAPVVGGVLRVKESGVPSCVNRTFVWFMDGSSIFSGDTFAVTLSDFDKQIKVEGICTRAHYATVKKTSTTIKIEAGTLTLTATPTVSGTFKVGQTLTATPGTWDEGVNLTYQWLRDGAAITGANKDSFLLSTGDSGKQLSVEVTGTKTGYATVKKTSTAIKIEAGTLTLTPTPTVSGTFKVGQTLTATPGTWDEGVNLTYQWSRDGLSITSATKTTYTITLEDFGKNITFTVNGTKPGYVTVSKESSKATVSAGSLTSTTPKITGTAKTGSVLKVTTNAWTKGANITYQWLANGLAIKGATSSSLKLATSHKGKKISVKVTQSALGYTTASKTSATVTVK